MHYLPIQVKYLLIYPARLIQKMLKCERLLEPMLLAYVIIIAFSIAFYLGIEKICFASFKYI